MGQDLLIRSIHTLRQKSLRKYTLLDSVINVMIFNHVINSVTMYFLIFVYIRSRIFYIICRIFIFFKNNHTHLDNTKPAVFIDVYMYLFISLFYGAIFFKISQTPRRLFCFRWIYSASGISSEWTDAIYRLGLSRIQYFVSRQTVSQE